MSLAAIPLPSPYTSHNTNIYGKLIGASVSEPHTSLFNCNFSLIIYLSYVVHYP